MLCRGIGINDSTYQDILQVATYQADIALLLHPRALSLIVVKLLGQSHQFPSFVPSAHKISRNWFGICCFSSSTERFRRKLKQRYKDLLASPPWVSNIFLQVHPSTIFYFPFCLGRMQCKCRCWSSRGRVSSTNEFIYP